MAILQKEQIIMNKDLGSKEELFELVSQKAKSLNIIDDTQDFIQGLKNREDEVSTCFEHGIAIPHCRSQCVKKASVFIVSTNNDIRWDDESSAHFIILLAIPDDASSTHIRLLSKIARKLVDNEFVEQILSATSCDDIMDCFKEFV